MRAKVAAALAVCTVTGLGLGQCTKAEPEKLAQTEPASARSEPVPPLSNIHRGDYVGPEACADCHGERYQQWRNHPHSRMNQNASARTVVGDFSGVGVDYGEVRTVFERQGEDFVMSYYARQVELEGEPVLLRRDRVTRTIGSRLQQAYVGVQVEGPEPPEHPVYTTERALPFVYWFSRGGWYPEHYVEQYPRPEYDEAGALQYPVDDPYARGTRPWAEGCLLCHNTYAYEFRLTRDFPGRGFGDVEVAAGLRGALATGPSPEQLVVLGVSCEACHFGGREHVTREGPMPYRPMSPVLAAGSALEAGSLQARELNSICAQCHVAGTLPHPNDAASINSSEAKDMLSGACSSQIRCTDCHDPHVAGPPEASPDDPNHVATCTGCHESLAGESHTRHSPQQASCLDCHMPRITQGIDTVVRTHRIDSPTNVDMLEQGSPNACNLCHLDRSMAWTLDQLAAGWGVQIAPSPEWEQYYGEDLQRPVGQAWLEHPTPINRLLAADAYGRSPLGRAALTDVLPILMDPYPQNRMFGLFAIEAMLGERLEGEAYTPTAPPKLRARQVQALRNRFVQGR